MEQVSMTGIIPKVYKFISDYWQFFVVIVLIDTNCILRKTGANRDTLWVRQRAKSEEVQYIRRVQYGTLIRTVKDKVVDSQCERKYRT